MNQKAKPHKLSSVVEVQNGIGVLGLCRFVSEEFDNKAQTKTLAYMLVDAIYVSLCIVYILGSSDFDLLGVTLDGCDQVLPLIQFYSVWNL